MGAEERLLAVDPNLKQIVFNSPTMGDVSAFLPNSTGNKLYFYTSKNYLYCLDMGGVKNFTTHKNVNWILSHKELNKKVKPPTSILRSLIVGLKGGDIYKIDPSDDSKQEIIASLDDDINTMEIDDET